MYGTARRRRRRLPPVLHPHTLTRTLSRLTNAIKKMPPFRCQRVLSRHLNASLAREPPPGGILARACSRRMRVFVEGNKLFFWFFFHSLSGPCPRLTRRNKPGNEKLCSVSKLNQSLAARRATLLMSSSAPPSLPPLIDLNSSSTFSSRHYVMATAAASFRPKSV